MGKLKNIFDTSNLSTVEQLTRFVSIAFQEIVSVVNGNLDFGENIRSQQLDVIFDIANSEVSISHTLGRVPNGAFLVKSDVSTNIYNGTSDNTSSTIYLRSSAVANTTVVVF